MVSSSAANTDQGPQGHSAAHRREVEHGQIAAASSLQFCEFCVRIQNMSFKFCRCTKKSSQECCTLRSWGTCVRTLMEDPIAPKSRKESAPQRRALGFLCDTMRFFHLFFEKNSTKLLLFRKRTITTSIQVLTQAPTWLSTGALDSTIG